MNPGYLKVVLGRDQQVQMPDFYFESASDMEAILAHLRWLWEHDVQGPRHANCPSSRAREG